MSPELRTMLRSLRATVELHELGSPESSVLRLDGLSAAITPACPDRSVVNSVAVEDFGGLERALPELAAAYADAGVRAWTVWVPESQAGAAALLADAGHRLDAAPAGLIADLSELGDPPGPEPEVDPGFDMVAACSVNDQAYGDEPGLSARAIGQLPPSAGHLYLARAGDGSPASFVFVHDHEGDCVFWLAATVPAARGRGLVSGLLHRALSDARDRGCTTSTTQASRMGAPVYARIGYRPVEPIQMWERREPKPGA